MMIKHIELRTTADVKADLIVETPDLKRALYFKFQNDQKYQKEMPSCLQAPKFTQYLILKIQ